MCGSAGVHAGKGRLFDEAYAGETPALPLGECFCEFFNSLSLRSHARATVAPFDMIALLWNVIW